MKAGGTVEDDDAQHVRDECLHIQDVGLLELITPEVMSSTLISTLSLALLRLPVGPEVGTQVDDAVASSIAVSSSCRFEVISCCSPHFFVLRISSEVGTKRASQFQ